MEIACGDSEFSLNASKYAKTVLATDISLERFRKRGIEAIPKNLQFMEMDAANLDIDNDAFDVTVCYNALGHLEDFLKLVLTEMTRVTIKNGYLIFIATWKLDKAILSKFKDIISDYTNLELIADNENKGCRTVIIRKKNMYAK